MSEMNDKWRQNRVSTNTFEIPVRMQGYNIGKTRDPELEG